MFSNIFNQVTQLSKLVNLSRIVVSSDKAGPTVQAIATTYNTQRDNKRRPNGACNVTTLWMLLEESCTEMKILDDDIMKLLGSPAAKAYAKAEFGHTVDWYINNSKLQLLWKMLEWAGCIVQGASKSDKQFKSEGGTISKHYDLGKGDVVFTYLSLEEMGKMIDRGRRVVIGGKFTKTGHFTIMTGYIDFGNGTRSYIVHDPWGDATTGYKCKSGDNRVYTRNYLEKVLHHDNMKTQQGIIAYRSIVVV